MAIESASVSWINRASPLIIKSVHELYNFMGLKL